jgi:hypothetical protein
MFKNVTGKMGNMKKAVDWVLYPQQPDSLDTVIIQSDKRIAKVDLNTGKAVVSNGKGHPGFICLSPALGATTVDVPPDMLQTIKKHVGTGKPEPACGKSDCPGCVNCGRGCSNR